MQKIGCSFAVSALLLAVSAPASAGIPHRVDLTCPVGGEKFEHIETVSYSIYGTRPDGKPYGSWQFPIPIPECPGNRLVLYKDFDATEIEKLKSLVATPEYVSLAGETGYYRAAWLMQALNDGSPSDRLWMMVRASWQVDDDLERKARYQREFAEGVAALPAAPEDIGWIALNARAANAWRELGEFERAEAVVQRVPVASLDVPIPAEKVEGQTASGLGKIIANAEEVEAAKNKRSWIDYLENLGQVIARRDSSSEPLDMIPLTIATSKCMEWEQSQPAKIDPGCDAERIKTAIAKERQS